MRLIEGEAAPTPESAQADGDANAAAVGNSVVLKIRRRKFRKTPQQGEIIVTRRLFRTGDSEYLLNGKLCRLRDIQDIFMGTGLGPESYAIIEQGRIGQILSSKPTDRRNVWPLACPAVVSRSQPSISAESAMTAPTVRCMAGSRRSAWIDQVLERPGTRPAVSSCT